MSFKLFKAKEEFSWFDFGLVEGKEGNWYFDNQQEEKKKVYEEYMKENKAETYEERAIFMNKYMKETHNFEGGEDLIARSRKIRDRLKYYGKEFKANKIAVVSHFYTISYTMSEEFSEKAKPIPSIHVNNASPI